MDAAEVIPCTIRKKCTYCFKFRGRMRCLNCMAWYCNKVCQADDWITNHQNVCKPLPALVDAFASNSIKKEPIVKAEGDEQVFFASSAEDENHLIVSQQREVGCVGLLLNTASKEASKDGNKAKVSSCKVANVCVKDSLADRNQDNSNNVVRRVKKVVVSNLNSRVDDIVDQTRYKKKKIVESDGTTKKICEEALIDQCVKQVYSKAIPFHGWSPSKIGVKKRMAYDALLEEAGFQNAQLDPEGAQFGLCEEDFLVSNEGDLPLLEVVMSRPVMQYIDKLP